MDFDQTAPNAEKALPRHQSTAEKLLVSEVEFWKDMIDSHDRPGEPADVVERMRQALALAEFRLMEWRAQFRANAWSVAGKPGRA